MVAILPATEVPKPTPSLPLRYGLFQAAVGPLPMPDAHVRGGGLWYRNAMCGGGQGYEVNCIDALDLKVFSTNGLDIVTGVPFIVMSNYQCMMTDLADAEAMTRQKLLSVEQSIVEQVFSSGTFAQAPSLANNPDVTTIVSGATRVTDVISNLETAIYCTSQYGAPAYLHMPIPVFNRIMEDRIIEFDGQRWRTGMGSVVSAGCYANLSPAGAVPAAGTFWIYATGQTTIWQDRDPFIAPVEAALDRTTNQYTGMAEREYVVTFECAAYASSVVLWP